MILRSALIPLIAVILLAGLTVAVPAMTITGSARISDGDTISIEGTRIRLNGIDAPETDQVCLDKADNTYACGIAARDALTDLVQGRSVTCSGDEIDRYDRRIMTCFVGDTDINAAMVAGGCNHVTKRHFCQSFRAIGGAGSAGRTALFLQVADMSGVFISAAPSVRPSVVTTLLPNSYLGGSAVSIVLTVPRESPSTSGRCRTPKAASSSA